MALPISSCVVFSILDLIRYDLARSTLEQQRDLQSLSLVSRQWSLDAQTVLFRDVRLEDAERCKAFLMTVNGEGKQKRLGSAVRRLRMTISGHPHSTLPSEGHLLQVLASTPRLYELEIDCAMVELSGLALTALKDVSCAPTALRFNNISGIETRALYQLAKLWERGLKFLVVGGGRNCSYSLLSEPSMTHENSFRGVLKEFRWRGFDKPSDSVIRYFLLAPPACRAVEGLSYLAFDSLPSTDVLKEVLRIHGGCLRSYESRDSIAGIADVLLEHCSGGQLEELSIRLLTAVPPLQGLLAGPLGNGLKHLQVTMGWSRSLPAMTQSIQWLREQIDRRTHLRSLESLTLIQHGPPTTPRWQWDSLKTIVSSQGLQNACISKGIDMTVKTMARTQELDNLCPLVETIHFPRRPSVSDYRLMSAVPSSHGAEIFT